MDDGSGHQAIRWYRGDAFNPGVLIGAAIAVIGLVGVIFGSTLSIRIVGAVITAGGAYILLQTRRAGIGVLPGGVIVVSIFGRKDRIQWSEIEKFEAIRPPGSRTFGKAATVICRNRKPLFTYGCWVDTNKPAKLEKLDQIVKALEAERPSATPGASIASQDQTHSDG